MLDGPICKCMASSKFNTKVNTERQDSCPSKIFQDAHGTFGEPIGLEIAGVSKFGSHDDGPLWSRGRLRRLIRNIVFNLGDGVVEDGNV